MYMNAFTQTLTRTCVRGCGCAGVGCAHCKCEIHIRTMYVLVHVHEYVESHSDLNILKVT